MTETNRGAAAGRRGRSNTVTFEDYTGSRSSRYSLAWSRLVPRLPQAAAALSEMEQGWSESLYRLVGEPDARN
jgi:hypothetical protein